MAANGFKFQRDMSGAVNASSFGLPFPSVAKSAILATNTEQHFTVPSDYPYWTVVFSYSNAANVWIDNFTTAAVPTGAFAATTAILNPPARVVKAGSVLSFITADASGAKIGVELFPDLGTTAF